jgi:Mannosyl-glycoprotein endo-beta-N-acetylglucosaminidase
VIASAFFAAALPFAQQAHVATNVETSVILAQWADETGYTWPAQGNNPGNVGNTAHGGMVNYPTVEAGVQAYIETMLLGYYAAVRNAQGWQAQCYRLGESPWAGGHYEAGGAPPGNDLVKIVNANNLTQYDSPPPQPPAPQEDQMITAFEDTDPGGSRHVFVWEINRVVHWSQARNGPPWTWNVEVLPLPPS